MHGFNGRRELSQRDAACEEKGALHGRGDFSSWSDYLSQQQNQDDQRNRNSDEPEKNGHGLFLSRLKN
jgi:hypothetical protein